MSTVKGSALRMESVFYYLTRQTEELFLTKPEQAFVCSRPSQLQRYSLIEPQSRARVECVVGYSARCLHVFVRTDQENLTSRDRAYQNGDGFHFVLAAPRPKGKPSDEFHVIAVSPLDDTWRRKFVWYRNVATAFIPLSNTRVRYCRGSDGFYYVTVSVPWTEIEPLKPFLFTEYGFNISYVQAVNSGANVYMLCDDPWIQSEQSNRKYCLFEFEPPVSSAELEWDAALSSKHCRLGEDLTLELAVVSPDSCPGQAVIVKDSGEETVHQLSLVAGLNHFRLSAGTESLPVGRHQLRLQLKAKGCSAEQTMSFHVYSTGVLENITARVNGLLSQPADKFCRISVETLAFRCQELKTALEKLRPYESFEPLARATESLQADVEGVAQGAHLPAKGEKLRLAYRSQQDNTLQPFSLYIPKHLSEQPGLIVYLHGSGDDDRSVFGSSMLTRLAEEIGSILVAPKARGTSHAYAPQAALEDIVEVTRLVSGLFNASRTILIGFSMGGYGVLRTYDYCPQLFDALVVISGHPNLANRWHGATAGETSETHPNYCCVEYLERLRDVPIIVFHGKEDRNCSYTEVEPFLTRLRALNPHSKIVVTEGVGHSGLTEHWYRLLLDWQRKFK